MKTPTNIQVEHIGFNKELVAKHTKEEFVKRGKELGYFEGDDEQEALINRAWEAATADNAEVKADDKAKENPAENTIGVWPAADAELANSYKHIAVDHDDDGN